MKKDERRLNDVKIAKMEKDIEFIKESQKEFDEKFDKFIEHMDKRIDSIPTRFAPKYLETVFWWVMATIGTVLLGAILTLILR